MGRKAKTINEVDTIEPVSASGPPRVNGPWANSLRGLRLRLELEHFKQVVGDDLNADLILYFFPDVEPRLGISLEWVSDRLASLRAGKGCSQATFARLLPIFWRLPHLGWPVMLQGPPWPGYDHPIIDHRGNRVIRRAGGSVIPFPPRPSKKKEAA